MGMKFELFGNLKKKSSSGAPSTQQLKTSTDSGMHSMSDNMPAPLPPMPSTDSSMPPMPPAQPTSSFQPASQPNPNIMADVNDLASKGMPEAEMVQALKAKGYNFKEIDTALGQAIRSQVAGENLSSLAPGMAAEQPQDIVAASQDQSSGFSQQMMNQTDVTRNDNLEAMIESIVEERLTSFKTLIENINASIADIRGEIENLDTSLKSVETRTEGTVSDVKKDMDVLRDDFSEVSPKVSSIERAFKDVVPNLVDAISQVNDKLHIHSEKINTDSIDLNMSDDIEPENLSDDKKNLDEDDKKLKTNEKVTADDDKDIEKDSF